MFSLYWQTEELGNSWENLVGIRKKTIEVAKIMKQVLEQTRKPAESDVVDAARYDKLTYSTDFNCWEITSSQLRLLTYTNKIESQTADNQSFRNSDHERSVS